MEGVVVEGVSRNDDIRKHILIITKLNDIVVEYTDNKYLTIGLGDRV